MLAVRFFLLFTCTHTMSVCVATSDVIAVAQGKKENQNGTIREADFRGHGDQ